MSSVPAFSVGSALQQSQDATYECACVEETLEEKSFFRGVLIAAPAGLALWFGLLQLATHIIHRF